MSSINLYSQTSAHFSQAPSSEQLSQSLSANDRDLKEAKEIFSALSIMFGVVFVCLIGASLLHSYVIDLCRATLAG